MSEQQHPGDSLEAAWRDFDRPTEGQEFRHYKGGEYRIIETGFMEKSLEPAVVYKSLSDGQVWIRAAEDFFATVEVEGQHQPRFLIVEQE